MKPGGCSPTAIPESESAEVPLGLLLPWACLADVWLCGHLCKQKSQCPHFPLHANRPPLEFPSFHKETWVLALFQDIWPNATAQGARADTSPGQWCLPPVAGVGSPESAVEAWAQRLPRYLGITTAHPEPAHAQRAPPRPRRLSSSWSSADRHPQILENFGFRRPMPWWPKSRDRSGRCDATQRQCSLSRRGCLGERIEQATLKTLARLGAAALFPKGLERGKDYVTVGAGSDYEPMEDSEAGHLCGNGAPGTSATTSAAPCQPLQDWGGTKYVPMNRFLPGSFSSSSLPCSYKSRAGEPGLGLRATHCGVRGSLGLAGAQPCSLLPSELEGEYICIKYMAPDYIGIGTARPQPPNSCLNYVDLDLVPPLEARGDVPGPARTTRTAM
ncbi:PREDICTED: uncharacterized protein LOC103596937 [Galeopterus variegatus]|uniref:Uncharacterized protein LOC103596937 n=1 Tax=Galeopterus variegatus TaxID=482537 RepID=A0ABM0REA5_GALVR|nr:PREDICTED: uncharacterized protein LOC103596937 [Galeopterus variegatus]